jgi:hypothetical protein
MYRLDIYSIDTGERVTARQVSGDSGYVYRHQLAERMVKQMGYAEDFYVVEIEVAEDGSEQVLDKFRV